VALVAVACLVSPGRPESTPRDGIRREAKFDTPKSEDHAEVEKSTALTSGQSVTNGEASTDPASHKVGDSKSSASQAVDVLQDDMTEAEVAAALQVTHIAERSNLTGSYSLASVTYICRGRRYPAECIECRFFWFSSGVLRKSGEFVRTSEHVLRLRNWSRVQDWTTILMSTWKPVEPDFVVRRAEEWNAMMTKVEAIRDEE
jgi:hypothetical protein